MLDYLDARTLWAELWEVKEQQPWRLSFLFIFRANAIRPAAGQTCSQPVWAQPWGVPLPGWKRCYVCLSSSALVLLNETELRVSRTCLLSGSSLSFLCRSPSGGGKWYRPGAFAKKAFFIAATLLSLKKQNSCQVTVATGFVCPLTCEGWHSGPWQWLVLLLLLCICMC